MMWWKYLLAFLGVLFLLVFLVALFVYGRRRKKKQRVRTESSKPLLDFPTWVDIPLRGPINYSPDIVDTSVYGVRGCESPKTSSKSVRNSQKASPKGVRDSFKESPKGVRDSFKASPKGVRDSFKASPKGVRDSFKASPKGVRDTLKGSKKALTKVPSLENFRRQQNLSTPPLPLDFTSPTDVPPKPLANNKALVQLKPQNYERSHAKNFPRLVYQLCYLFQSNELRVRLLRGRNLPENYNEQIVISVVISKTAAIFRSSPSNGPDPDFHENNVFRFPIEFQSISEDPVATLKFIVWTVDRYSKRKFYGYHQVVVEEVFHRHGVIPNDDKGIESGKVVRCTNLTDGNALTEMYVRLTYLSSARRISVVVGQIKNLRDDVTGVQARVAFRHRNVERAALLTEYKQSAQLSVVHFNQEFVFKLDNYREVTIDRLSILIEVQTREKGILFGKARSLGKVRIGSSGKRREREHWVEMMSSTCTTSMWHTLETSHDVVT